VRVGLLGIFTTDLTDITRERATIAAELGFHGVGAHIVVPAGTIAETTLTAARTAIADQGLEFLQLWGRYPCLISPEESVRRAGVAEVRALIGVTARLGVPARQTTPSLNTKRVSPHTLRHTCAVHLLRAGVDINTIRAWLGHVSLDTTHVYAEVDLEMKAKALAQCDLPEEGTAKRWRTEPSLMGFLKTL
jgi:hypothetical protein